MTSAPGVGWQYKGWPRGVNPTGAAIGNQQLNVFGSDFLFPLATISSTQLNHNVSTVAQFCTDHDVSLAPHAKTTMAPEIVEQQLGAGAWGMTVATVSQAETLRAFGVVRIVIAHQVVDPGAVRWISDELADPEVQIISLVDSVASVNAMERALVDRSMDRPLDVLVELGYTNGRTGCRTVVDAIEVAEAVAASASLRLVGVEGYEGMVPTPDDDHTALDQFLTDLGTLATELDARQLFNHLDEVIITAGGSMFPDRVVAVLDELELSKPNRLVIRSGCYVTHDSAYYAEGAPFGVRPPMDTYPPLQAALMVWAYVVSRPQPDLVILGFGKRDAGIDVDLPKPHVLRRNGEMRELDGELEVFSLNDQHAYVRVNPEFDVAVGDIIGCGISHPCTTFDKWKAIPLVDDDFTVVGTIRTFF